MQDWHDFSWSVLSLLSRTKQGGETMKKCQYCKRWENKQCPIYNKIREVILEFDQVPLDFLIDNLGRYCSEYQSKY